MNEIDKNWPKKMPVWARRIAEHMTSRERTFFVWLMILLVVSGLWSIVGYINRNTELIPQTGGLYREAAVGQPRHINPVVARANDVDADISQLVYSSLFKLDNELNLKNDLATGFEISEDSKTYTVTLRSDTTWHDGEPVTADDVIFTIRSIQTPDYGSPLQSAFEQVAVEKVDDYSISFILEQPYAPFLASLTVGIIPEHVWENVAPQNATLAEQMLKPVGSGPYRFSEITTRRKTGEITEFHLVRNESYYGEHQLLDGIIFYFFNSHEEALDALSANTVDGIGFLPLQLKNAADGQVGTVIHRLSLPQYFGLFFNTQENEILADAGIRNALAQATDRQAIVNEALDGEGEAVHLPIPPGVFGYNTELAAPNYNPEAAKNNLEEAGWTDQDGDGVREKDDTRLRLKITTTDWAEYIATAEIVQKQWQDLGVEVEIEHLGAGTIQQTVIRPRDYEILLFGEILAAIPDPYPFWHSTQTRSPGLNFALFADKNVDKLLEEARKTLDENERLDKYKEFQGIILDVKPALMLYRPLYLFAAHKSVRGIDASVGSIPSDRLNNIENWHVRTKRVWR